MRPCGGDEEVRTPDPLRARQVLSQLSYTPVLAFHAAFEVVTSVTPSKSNNIYLASAKPFMMISHHADQSSMSSFTHRFSLERR